LEQGRGHASEEAARSPNSLPPTSSQKGRLVLHAITFSCLAYLLVSVIFIVIQQFAGSVGQRILLILGYAFTDAAALLASWLFLVAGDGLEFSTLGLTFHPAWKKELASGLGVGAGLMGTVVAAMVAARLATYSGLALEPRPSIGAFAAIAVFLFLAAALEEITYRGYAFQRLIDAVGAPAAVVITSVAFGVAHGGNPAVTPLSTVNTVLAGMVMACGYLRVRSLWLPIGLHFAWNLVLGPVASLPVSGLRLGFALFSVHIAGPIWLTGGDYGPEGSVILTMVTIGGIVWMAGGLHLLLPAGRKTP
jgi:membrane protease YdiL (CAAX protease family)